MTTMIFESYNDDEYSIEFITDKPSGDHAPIVLRKKEPDSLFGYIDIGIARYDVFSPGYERWQVLVQQHEADEKSGQLHRSLGHFPTVNKAAAALWSERALIDYRVE